MARLSTVVRARIGGTQRRPGRWRVVGAMVAFAAIVVGGQPSPALAAGPGDGNLADPPAGYLTSTICGTPKTLEIAGGKPGLVAQICVTTYHELASLVRVHMVTRLINESNSVPYYIGSLSIADTPVVGQYVDFCQYNSWLFPGKQLNCGGNSTKPWPHLTSKAYGRAVYHAPPTGQLKAAEFDYWHYTIP